MPKNKTVRYYTDSSIYVGWEHFTKQNTLSYKSWINSGNILKIKGPEGDMVYGPGDIARLMYRES